MFIYYVYAYIREDGTPYYIGKGKGRRKFSLDHVTKPPKDLTRIITLETNLSDIGALALERRLIRWWGRKDIGTGILHNRTDGGEGVVNMSDETKSLLSKAGKGRKLTPEQIHKRSMAMIGHITTEVTKQKISNTLKGRTFTEEWRIKQSKAHSGKKQSPETLAKKKLSLQQWHANHPDQLARARAIRYGKPIPLPIQQPTQ